VKDEGRQKNSDENLKKLKTNESLGKPLSLGGSVVRK
jgi:hypothetical protein